MQGFGKNISCWMAAQRFYRESAQQLDRSANIPRTLKALERKSKSEAQVYGEIASPLFDAVMKMLKLESGIDFEGKKPFTNEWTVTHPADREPAEKPTKGRWGYHGRHV